MQISVILIQINKKYDFKRGIYMISQIIKKSIEYDESDPRRICHFLKVHSFAKTIGEIEMLEKNVQEVLEISAILHDIGIHNCEQKYNSTAGNYQEIEGPIVALKILEEFDIPKEIIERVCYLIGHHHTYASIDGFDYQILVEADFLVNIYEDNMNENQINSIKDRIFKTKTGINFLKRMYL